MIAIELRLRRDSFTLDVAFTSSARVLALHGPSGSGKSTIASLVAGLLRPDEGRVAINGATLVDTRERIYLPPEKRRIGYVFQDALLFPHLSVRQNILFSRFFAKKDAPRASVAAVVETLGIGALLDRRPSTLSGGERQRVGLARAVLASPRLLLMDEPMASLDFARRQEIMGLIERLRDEFAIPIMFVSHSAEEIARLADDVVVLDAGKIAAQGVPEDILPGASRLIEGGRFALASALTTQFGAYDAAYGVTLLAHPAGEIIVVAKVAESQRPIRVEVKATDVALAKERPQDMSLRTVLRGTITGIDADGSPLAFVTIELAGGERLISAVTRLAIHELQLAPGDNVFALVKSVALDERGL